MFNLDILKEDKSSYNNELVICSTAVIDNDIKPYKLLEYEQKIKPKYTQDKNFVLLEIY